MLSSPSNSETREKDSSPSRRAALQAALQALAFGLVFALSLPLGLPLSLPIGLLLGFPAQAQEKPAGEGLTAGDALLQKRLDALQGQVERLSKDVGNLGRMEGQPSAGPSQGSPAWLSFVAEMQERLRVLERTLVDLTGRVEQLERYGGKGKENPAENPVVVKRAADEQFSEAQGLLRAQKVEDAVRVFDLFVKNHPNDPRVAEALFFLGEIYAVMQDDKAAMKSFLNGYKKDRDGSFAPRLLLRLGQTLAKLKKTEQACRVLREFRKRFRETDADMTKLAESELKANSCSGS